MPAIFPTTEPNITLRVLPKIPATMQGASGISVLKANGIWTVAPKWESLLLTTPSNLLTTEVWLRDTVTNQYSRATLGSLVGNITTSAGPPSGTPAATPGFVPARYDTTNNRLYVFNGTWKSVALT